MPEETLGMRLRFNGDAAIAGMRRASGAFAGMQKGAQQAKRGVQDLRSGFAGARMGALAVAGGAAVAVKKFVGFEQQFGAVKAVIGAAKAEHFPALREEAMKLGASTSFTAVQAAEAMENLARSGMEPHQILKSIGPVLNAAAAEGMDLGSAADIVASNLKAFGLEADQAGRVADTLAFVSSKTNTNMVALQEGLKFAGPIARGLGVSLEDTAATMGLFADVGLKGSLAGTGFKNALLKIAKNAKDGSVKVGKFNAEIVNNVDASGKVTGVNLQGTMANIIKQLTKIKDPMKRTNAGMKLLGLRGIGAATAFQAMTKEKADILFAGMADGSKDAAKKMARMRLDNIHGDFVRLTSAVEGFAIQIGSVMGPTVAEVAKSAQVFFGDAAKAFVELAKGGEGSLKGLSATAVGFAKGLREGFAGAKTILGTFFDIIKGGARFLSGLFSAPGTMGEAGPGIKGVTKFVIQFGALAIGLKTVGSLTARFGKIATGTFRVLSGTLKMMKPAVAGTVNFLSKRLPALTKVLPRGLSKLTGAVSGVEKLTAQPVRVVNWDEAGMGGIAGRGPGAGPGQAGGPAAGVRKSWSELGKLGRVARVAGSAVGVLGAALAGWQIGKAIDQATGASSAIADWTWKMTENMPMVKQYVEMERQLARARFQKGAVKAGGSAMQNMVRNMAAMAGRGVMLQERDEKGKIKKTAITQELVRAKIRQRLKHEPKQVREAIIAGLQPMLDKIPTKEDLLKQPPIVVKLLANAREIGKVTAGAEDEKRSRGLKPAPRGGKARAAPRTRAAR